MDVMLENYLRRMEANQEKIIKLLEGIGAELVLQRTMKPMNLSATIHESERV